VVVHVPKVQMNIQVEQSIEMTSRSRKPFIAIVDDDISICRSLKRLVESHGIEADTFSSGLEFTDLVENMPSFDPQCVILDMHMPGLNGVQVLQRMAKRKPRLPVIFLTGTRDPYTFQLALTSGAVAALHKPVADSVLMANLRTILKMETGEEK